MHPRPETFWLCLLLTLAAAPAPRAANAVVVLKRGVDTPLMGHLIRSNDRSVVVRQELPGGKSRDVTIPRSDIEELLETVSPERLATLNPAHPATYLEYAEELAEKRRDPEARDTARRLLTIAAGRGNASLRHSCLLVLADLTRTPDERRRIQALIYLADPRHDRSLLTIPVTSAADSDPASVAELVFALRLIRQGQGAAAKATLDKKTVQAELSRGILPFTLAELTTLAGERTLSDAQLARVLRAELALESDSSAAVSDKRARWSQAATSQDLAPIRPLDFDNLTEFDPAECIYKDGQWRHP